MKYGPIMPWAYPCPATCNSIPVYTEKINVGIKIQSITKIFFIGFLFYIDDTKYTISKETRR